MDVVEYVKQRRRMCDYYVNCGDCPASNCEWCASLNEIPNMVPIVEQWAKEHPVKTRQSEFLKMFPNAKKSPNGVIDICPRKFEPEEYKSTTANGVCIHSDEGYCCDKCCHDFWLKEIE